MPPEFDEFSSLWREEVSADEQRAFAVLADRSRRRAKLVDLAERGLAGLLILAVAGLLVLAPEPATVIVGLIAVIGLAWFSWKRHLLHQLSAATAGGAHDDYVDAAIERVRGALGRARLGLIFFWPLAFTGSLLGQSVREGGRLQNFLDHWREQALERPTGLVLTIALVGLYVMMIRSFRRLRIELTRLRRLEDEYRVERDNEDSIVS